ncbi:hypothetical protein [Thioalkalivibrio denitrificans]|nr:hypothetical protein [Thioalkalivibrio denitrificans]
MAIRPSSTWQLDVKVSAKREWITASTREDAILLEAEVKVTLIKGMD